MGQGAATVLLPQRRLLELLGLAAAAALLVARLDLATLAAGLGLFLWGMTHLEDAIKRLSGGIPPDAMEVCVFGNPGLTRAVAGDKVSRFEATVDTLSTPSGPPRNRSNDSQQAEGRAHPPKDPPWIRR